GSLGPVAAGTAGQQHDVVGLAISGGGIRSATFALGVIQGLARREVLRHVDVMSTVSGGGYLGSFLSSYLNNSDADCGPTADRAPFKSEIAGDSRAVRSLRNHSRYIQPATFDRWIYTVAQAAYGIASNLIILSFWVFVAVLITYGTIRPQLRKTYDEIYGKNAGTDTVMAAAAEAATSPEQLNTAHLAVDKTSATLQLDLRIPLEQPQPDTETQQPEKRSYWALTNFSRIWIVVAIVCVLLLPIVQRIRHLRNPAQARISWYEMGTVGILVTLICAIAIDQLPAAHYGYMALMKWIGTNILTANPNAEGWSLTATLVAIGNLFGLLVARAQWLRSLIKVFPILGRAVFLLLWLCGPLLFAYSYFELCRVYVAAPHAGFNISGYRVTPLMLLATLAVGSLLYSLLCNVNFTSLHRYYRNRLSETYLLLHSSTDQIKSQAALKLQDLRSQNTSTAPYHLVNAALNLPSSSIDDLRGRDCDFFLFSKHYCGSPVVGYHGTTEWEESDRHLDLGTAMAISGAAAAPQMGMGTIRSASFLLTLLNIRLGYWLRRPYGNSKPWGISKFFQGPGPWRLLQESLNWMTDDSNYLNVSDGGHIENLGIYELLRRRCRFIIAVDGERDEALTFPSLRKLQRFAEVDFNTTIDMNVERIEWTSAPGKMTVANSDNKDGDSSDEPTSSPPRFSRGHFAIGKINYPPVDDQPVTGWLLYIKLSVTGNEPDYVLD
ncbi:MAG: patatin-like phospholipase family protein, partial [Planctomycetaceae bacterium]|nr:patatin-like phospholipase family protein [Planctomycetaceae bacterium]